MPTLAHLVETLGPAVLRVLTTPGLDLAGVGELVVYDPVDPPILQRSDVLLGVGLRGEMLRACEVVGAAGSAMAAAVLIKPGDTDLPTLIGAAEKAGVTLIALPVGMRWENIDALLRQAIGATAATATGLSQVGDLFGFANMLAGLVGGAVTIEDTNSQVLAYSTLVDDELDEARREVILQRRVPEQNLEFLRARGVFRELYKRSDVVRVEPDARLGIRRRLAIAVRAEDEVLATLWVLEGHQPLRAEAERALCDAARVATAHIIRARSDGYVLWERRENLLKNLLEGGIAAHIAGPLLGFDPNYQWRSFPWRWTQGPTRPPIIRPIADLANSLVRGRSPSDGMLPAPSSGRRCSLSCRNSAAMVKRRRTESVGSQKESLLMPRSWGCPFASPADRSFLTSAVLQHHVRLRSRSCRSLSLIGDEALWPTKLMFVPLWRCDKFSKLSRLLAHFGGIRYRPSQSMMLSIIPITNIRCGCGLMNSGTPRAQLNVSTYIRTRSGIG